MIIYGTVLETNTKFCIRNRPMTPVVKKKVIKMLYTLLPVQKLL